jgi:hypothetical protein
VYKEYVKQVLRSNTFYKSVNYKKGRTRLIASSDKVYQLLAHGRWFSSGTLASSITITGHDDIAEILLKVALTTNCVNNSLLNNNTFEVEIRKEN